MNTTIQQLMDRKSVRVFENREIPVELQEEILNAACAGPTAGNQQLYTILKITDQKIKDELSVSCDHQAFIATAPMVLIFLADYRKWYRAYQEIGIAEPRKLGAGDLLLAVEDTVIAAQNAVCAAESLGIGSCYIGDIMEHYEFHKELLGIPEYVYPACMLVFGYPTEQQKTRKKPDRAALKHIVHENTYRDHDGAELREMFTPKSGETTFEQRMNFYYNKKYNSDFSKEMTRSMEMYLKEYRD